MSQSPFLKRSLTVTCCRVNGGPLNNRTTICSPIVLASVVTAFHISFKKQISADKTKVFDFMSWPLKWQGQSAPDFTVKFLNDRILFFQGM